MQNRTIEVLSYTALLTSFVTYQTALGFRGPDMSGDDANAAAVFSFSEAGGSTANDSAGTLNLNMSTAGNLPTSDGTPIRTNAILTNGMLIVNPKPNGIESGMADQGYQSAQRHRTFLESSGPAVNLNSCTNGITVQAFVRPWFPFQGSQAGNLIVGLSNSEGANAVLEPNFGVYQSGQAGSESVMFRLRTGNNQAASITSVPGALSSVRENENPGRLTEIIATQEPSGVLTVYVNRIARSSLTPATPNFLAGAKLVIGNELVPLSLNTDTTTNINQQRNWSGEIYHLAIYCRGFTRTEILGAIAENKARAEVVRPLNGAVESSRVEARKLVERLSGVVVPIDHPMVLRVASRLAANDRLGAAKIVTGDVATREAGHPDFLNLVIKQMALKMSNREETFRVPLNDFAAAFIGITRDEVSAKELLTGDFYYIANPAKARVRTDMFRDMLVSNNHYEDLETAGWDIGKVLMRVPSTEAGATFPNGQQIALDTSGALSPNPDPAGVLTSRAFMQAHAIAGTNRRLVEYAFKAFMCMPMAEMADTSASPARIGRDVERMPGGDVTKFETSCKGCHSVMDGFRGAFAKFDFMTFMVGGTTYSLTRNTQLNNTGPFAFGNQVDQFGTVRKMNHNETAFPNGYVTIDDSFVNNAVGSSNRTLFGWKGANKIGGVGINQFGRMLADSDRFSQCMAKRAYEAVCMPNARHNSQMNELINSFATRFRDGGYKLRALFADVGSHPACGATMGR